MGKSLPVHNSSPLDCHAQHSCCSHGTLFDLRGLNSESARLKTPAFAKSFETVFSQGGSALFLAAELRKLL